MRVGTFASCGALVLAACGSGSQGPAGDGSGAGPRIFVTAADFLGDFGTPGTDGAAMADHQCQTAAAGAGFSGTWTAWLAHGGYGSLPSRTAPERITGQGPWYLTGTNELVFLNRSALANTPRVAIDHNELGIQVAPGPVWTGANVGGALSLTDCTGWTTGNSAYDATVGQLDATSSSWTDSGSQHCSVRAHLYCLEM